LVAALAEQLPRWRVSGVAAGLHLLVELPAGVRADAVTRAAAVRGVQVMDLRTCRAGDGDGPQGLVLGYGNLADRLVEQAVGELAAAVRTAGAG
ncbi:MAG: PLP-dependent aminotransferase family protein, partial [Propionicimonas sp.]|nr:PLP-dependent aminotransferase family protein [Propionicimonas sp.]